MAKKFKFKKHAKLKRYNSFREILDAAVKSRPDHLAYRYKKGEGIEDVTVKEFYDEVEALGASLAKLGAKKSHIALIGENSYNWIVCLYSVIMSDSVLVPLDKELPAEQIVNLINEGDVDYILCDGAKELIIKREIESIGRVKNVICFDRDEDDGIFISYRKIVEEGKLLDKSEYKAMTNSGNEGASFYLRNYRREQGRYALRVQSDLRGLRRTCKYKTHGRFPFRPSLQPHLRGIL